MTRFKDLPLPAGYTSDPLWGLVCPWCGGATASGSGHWSTCPVYGFVPVERLDDDILLQEAYASGYAAGYQEATRPAASPAEIRHERLLNGEPE